MIKRKLDGVLFNLEVLLKRSEILDERFLDREFPVVENVERA